MLLTSAGAEKIGKRLGRHQSFSCIQNKKYLQEEKICLHL